MVISELHSSSLAAPVSRRICSKLTTALTYPKLEVSCEYILREKIVYLFRIGSPFS